MKNEKATPYIVNGLISLGIAIASGIYISNIPEAQPKYNPIEVKIGKYNLVDVNNDKKVDLIKIDGKIKYINQSEEMEKIFGEISDYRFLGFHRNLKSITPEIQTATDSVFNGHLNEKTLEKVLLKEKK
ncbi:MAG: hypothetical protein AABY06_03565 [Nanoarchaeota archaeon]